MFPSSCISYKAQLSRPDCPCYARYNPITNVSYKMTIMTGVCGPWSPSCIWYWVHFDHYIPDIKAHYGYCIHDRPKVTVCYLG